MGKNKKRDKKELARAHSERNGGHESISLTQEFRDALGRALSGQDRQQILEESGLAYKRLCGIASGTFPPQSHEVSDLAKISEIIKIPLPALGKK